MFTLDYILDKYKLEVKPVIDIPNVTRESLTTLLHELDFRVGAEIGVQEGIYSEILCKNNPQMKLFGVDPWLTYVTHIGEDGPKSPDNKSSQEMCDKFYEETKVRMAPYNFEIIKESSMDAVKRFEDESLDFIYIDANHEYSHVMEDLTEWHKKLRKGGIISGHDYYYIKEPRSLMHVKTAVNAYVKLNKIKPLIIWGAQERKPKILRDKRRSWSWVKQ